jgi:hypothetical protein
VISNPALGVIFQMLPGDNSGLTSGGAELLLAPNWTLPMKFDGKFAANSQTYAGSGTLPDDDGTCFLVSTCSQNAQLKSHTDQQNIKQTQRW